MCTKTIAIFVKYDEDHYAVVGPDDKHLLQIVAGGAGKIGDRGTEEDLFGATKCPIKIDWTRTVDLGTGQITVVETSAG